MAEHRYYWLKMPEDFFNSLRIKKLRKLAGGDTFTIIYLKMQLLSVSKGGCLYFYGIEDDFCKEIALDIDEDEDNVRITINYLLETELLKITGENEYEIPFVKNNFVTESSSAQRVRNFRERQKTLQCNTDVTQVKQKRNGDIDIEIDIDNNNVHSEPSELEKLEHNFDIIYSIYPKKTGKAGAFKRYQQWVSKSGRKVNGRTYHLTNEQIYKAVKKYVSELESKDTSLQYYKGFDVLMGDSLLDYLDNNE